MTIASELWSGLTGNAGVAALTSTRVYPIYLPQRPTYPAISYQRISNTAQDGTSNRRLSRWQVNCWAATYAGAHALAAAVKTAMEEYHDVSGGIEYARVVNELDDYDDETDVYRIIVDVMLHTTGD